MDSGYTSEQVRRYLDYVGFTGDLHPDANRQRDLDLLTSLHAHQLSTIPYENLSLHYSKLREVNIDPKAIYAKIMSGRGRGGYCMENVTFFAHILRAIGFRVYTTAARIRLRTNGVPNGDYIGWCHAVNIVTLGDGSRWMVDVSFGGDGATKPLPLVDGEVVLNIGTQELRLVRDWIPEAQRSMHPTNGFDQKVWIYQYRNNPVQEWNSYYSFTDAETLHADLEMLNFYVSCHPTSFQRDTVLVVKFLRKENGIYGKLMLADEKVKRNDDGKTILVQICTTEQERVTALKEHFAITLTNEEQEGIVGFKTELPRKA